MNFKRIMNWLLPRKLKEIPESVDTVEPVVEQEDMETKDRHGQITTEFDNSVIEGWATQYSGLSESADSIRVIIGLDFGTAFTKVVIHGAGQKYAVPLNDDGKGIDKFLLPTCLYEDFAGALAVTPPDKFMKTHTDIKMRILDDNLDDNARKHIVTYIAWVLRKSRGWLMTEKRAVFGENYLKWEVNIGLPTTNDKNGQLRKIYKDIVVDAWYESTSPATSAGVFHAKNVERKLNAELITSYPEFAAHIQVYISSTQRKIGIHSLTDVGAGTVDATVFRIIEREGEFVIVILTSSVEKLGTAYLVEHRCNQPAQSSGWRPDPQKSFPSLDDFAKELEMSTENIISHDKEFKRKFTTQIDSCHKLAWNNFPDLHGIGEWENDVPFIFCGGGARVEFYKAAYYDVMEYQKKTNHGQSLHETNLPEFVDLDAPELTLQDNDRLSVAYGLSLGNMERKKIRYLSSDPAQNKTATGKPFSGHHTCPKCGGHPVRCINCPTCSGSGYVKS